MFQSESTSALRLTLLLPALCAVACGPASQSKPVAAAPAEGTAAVAPAEQSDSAAQPLIDPQSSPSLMVPPQAFDVPAFAKRTPSGLAYYQVGGPDSEGDMAGAPASRDTVTVHYTGWSTDGAMFDSSRKRGTPASFPLNNVIKGWTEGLQLMVPGQHFRFWIPGNLAYGEVARRPGAPVGMLIFDVELISVAAKRNVPEAPADVSAAPAEARMTDSGLAYRVLTENDQGRKPGPTSNVEVHYTGWTTDGKMFDSSVERGKTAKFPLNRVIKGWTEGLQLMREGESFRFWIPAALAYGEKPRAGAPSGMLVFDVQLISFTD